MILNAIEFAKDLKINDAQKFHELRALAYAYYWQGTVPQDEELKKMLQYVEFIEDESNRLYKQMQERM